MSEAPSTRKIFRLLKKKKLTPDKMSDTLAKWDSRHFRNFREQVVTLLESPDKNPHPTELFSFAASSSLSGDSFPCSGFTCRQARADELSRFAALYADHVYISNPLQLSIPDEVNDMDRFILASDIGILYQFRPLLQSGLMTLSRSRFRLCEKCASRLSLFVEETQTIARGIIKERIGEFKFTSSFDDTIGRRVASISGPKDLLDHSIKVIIHQQNIDAFSSTDVLDNALEFFSPFYSDIARHQVLQAGSYITDQTLEFDILNKLAIAGTQPTSHAMISELSHYLPIMPNVSVEEIINVRNNEGEAFRVYRDALTSAIKSAISDDQCSSKEIFNDIIRPELNKIDHIVKSASKQVKEELSADLVAGMGYVAIGALTGLISPTLGVCATTIGLTNIAGAIRKIWMAHGDPPSAEDNSYYFLWKVRK